MNTLGQEMYSPQRKIGGVLATERRSRAEVRAALVQSLCRLHQGTRPRTSFVRQAAIPPLADSVRRAAHDESSPASRLSKETRRSWFLEMNSLSDQRCKQNGPLIYCRLEVVMRIGASRGCQRIDLGTAVPSSGMERVTYGSPITARHWRIGLDGEPGVPGRVLILSLELFVEINVLPSALCFLNIRGGRRPQGFGRPLEISLVACHATLGLFPVGQSLEASSEISLDVPVDVLPSILCFLNIHGGRLPQGFGCPLGISLVVCLGTLGLLPVG